MTVELIEAPALKDLESQSKDTRQATAGIRYPSRRANGAADAGFGREAPVGGHATASLPSTSLQFPKADADGSE